MQMKACPACSRLLLATSFGRNRRNGDGLSTYCLACNRDKATRYYAARRALAGKRYRTRPQHPDGYKSCADCGEVKPLDQFHKAKSQSGGYNCYCKPCRSTRQRNERFLREYGLTMEALAGLIEGQGGTCAICLERPAEHVDHDHVTGDVRGVLCFSCNAALGQFRDRADVLRNAIDYLERTTWQRQQVAPGAYRLTSPRRAARPSPSSSELQRLICSRRG